MRIRYQSLAVGEFVSWPSINGRRSGVVESMDDRGALVLLDGGMYVLLTTGQSLQAAQERRRNIAKTIKNKRI